MKVNIKAVSFKPDSQLEEFIKGKVEKTAILFDGIIGSEVILKLDKKQAVKNKITEIRFEIPGYDLFAKKQANSFEEATELSIEAMRKQLIKYKEKLRSKRA